MHQLRASRTVIFKRKDNILVGTAEQPFVSWISAPPTFRRESPNGGLRRWLFNFMTQTDYNAWIKRKYRTRLPQPVSRRTAALYRPLPLERVSQGRSGNLAPAHVPAAAQAPAGSTLEQGQGVSLNTEYWRGNR